MRKRLYTRKGADGEADQLIEEEIPSPEAEAEPELEKTVHISEKPQSLERYNGSRSSAYEMADPAASDNVNEARHKQRRKPDEAVGKFTREFERIVNAMLRSDFVVISTRLLR
jgi:hypothetical protein